MASRARTMFIAVSACSLLVLSACAGKSSGGSGGGSATTSGGGSTAPGGTIIIANVTDFSGTQSVLGIDENAGLQLAVDQINAAGGIKSLGGAQLTIKKYDTESNPDNGVTQANKALSDGAKVIVGARSRTRSSPPPTSPTGPAFPGSPREAPRSRSRTAVSTMSFRRSATPIRAPSRISTS
jgi:hypothetical protein